MQKPAIRRFHVLCPGISGEAVCGGSPPCARSTTPFTCRLRGGKSRWNVTHAACRREEASRAGLTSDSFHSVEFKKTSFHGCCLPNGCVVFCEGEVGANLPPRGRHDFLMTSAACFMTERWSCCQNVVWGGNTNVCEAILRGLIVRTRYFGSTVVSFKYRQTNWMNRVKNNKLMREDMDLGLL